MAYDKKTGRTFDPDDPDQVAWNRSPNRGGDPVGVGGILYPGPGWQSRHPDYDNNGNFRHSYGHRREIKENKPMSDILSPDAFPVLVGSFHGGQERGPCIQLTTMHDEIPLTMAQVTELIEVLQVWHQRHAQWRMDKRRQGRRSIEMDHCPYCQKTGGAIVEFCHDSRELADLPWLELQGISPDQVENGKVECLDCGKLVGLIEA